MRYSFKDIRKDARRSSVVFGFIFGSLALVSIGTIVISKDPVSFLINTILYLFECYMVSRTYKHYMENREPMRDGDFN